MEGFDSCAGEGSRYERTVRTSRSSVNLSVERFAISQPQVLLAHELRGLVGSHLHRSCCIRTRSRRLDPRLPVRLARPGNTDVGVFTTRLARAGVGGVIGGAWIGLGVDFGMQGWGNIQGDACGFDYGSLVGAT